MRPRTIGTAAGLVGLALLVGLAASSCTAGGKTASSSDAARPAIGAPVGSAGGGSAASAGAGSTAES
ncbi:MAG TPA: Nuclear pore complex protein-Nup96 precursor, partial [Actinomycetota bacterium]